MNWLAEYLTLFWDQVSQIERGLLEKIDYDMLEQNVAN